MIKKVTETSKPKKLNKKLKIIGMTLAKVKEQDGMTLAKVKEQDGMTLAKSKTRPSEPRPTLKCQVYIPTSAA